MIESKERPLRELLLRALTRYESTPHSTASGVRLHDDLEPIVQDLFRSSLDDRDAALVAAEAEQRRLREQRDEWVKFARALYDELGDTPDAWAYRPWYDRIAAALGSVSAVPTDGEPAAIEPEHWCDCPADACRGIGPDPGGCSYCWAKDTDEPCPNSGLYNDERDNATTLQDLHEWLGLTPEGLLAKGFRIVPAVPTDDEPTERRSPLMSPHRFARHPDDGHCALCGAPEDRPIHTLAAVPPEPASPPEDALWPLHNTDGLRDIVAELERLGTATGDYTLMGLGTSKGGVELNITFENEVDGVTIGREFAERLMQCPSLLADACRRLLAADAAYRAVPLSVEEASDACAFCLDVECDGVACIARLDPDDPDDLAEVERLQALLRSGRVTAGSGGRR